MRGNVEDIRGNPLNPRKAIYPIGRSKTGPKNKSRNGREHSVHLFPVFLFVRYLKTSQGAVDQGRCGRDFGSYHGRALGTQDSSGALHDERLGGHLRKMIRGSHALLFPRTRRRAKQPLNLGKKPEVASGLPAFSLFTERSRGQWETRPARTKPIST